jgi:hypothetical protein
MKLINLKKIDPPRKTGLFQAAFEAAATTSYTFMEKDISVTKTMEVFYKSTPVGQYRASIPNFATVTDQSIEAYHFFQNNINYCNNNAEMLNIQLRDLLLLIKTTEEAKTEIYGLDFMNLRNKFSKYLNEDKSIRELDKLNTNKKRKEATTTFYQYIIDRNIYTHGKLKLLLPDEKFYIDYVLEKREPARVEINKEMIQSFLDISIELKIILNDIHLFVQKQRMLE